MDHTLVIEIDGGQHNFDEHARRDVKRDAHFIRDGYRVLRFCNNEVDQSLYGVLTLIDEALQAATPSDRPSQESKPE